MVFSKGPSFCTHIDVLRVDAVSCEIDRSCSWWLPKKSTTLRPGRSLPRQTRLLTRQICAHLITVLVFLASPLSYFKGLDLF